MESGGGSHFFSSQKGEGQKKLRALQGEGQKNRANSLSDINQLRYNINYM